MERRDLVLEVSGVSKRFLCGTKDVLALGEVSFEVAEGEFLCLIGESGCGKSTLLQMIAGFEKPSSGSLLYCGKRIEGPGAERSIVFQERSLLPWLTVEENIGLGLKIAGRAWKEESAEVLRSMGLEGFEKFYPWELSGGMAQRVAIGRALVSKAKLLLMDEPFGALDAFTRMRLQEQLLELWKANGLTVVLVTHDIDEAVFLGSRILTMASRPGRIANEVRSPLGYPRERLGDEFVEIRKEVLGSFMTQMRGVNR